MYHKKAESKGMSSIFSEGLVTELKLELELDSELVLVIELRELRRAGECSSSLASVKGDQSQNWQWSGKST